MSEEDEIILTKEEKTYFDKLNDEKKKIVKKLEIKFRKEVKNLNKHDDPGLKLNYLDLDRFLVAKKWDYDETVDYINEWIDWRINTKPQ
jgi:hypothetical protein